MYSSPSNCSEERLERLRRGEALFPTATRQMHAFLQANTSPKAHFQSKTSLIGTKKPEISRDMQEYISQKGFEIDMEMRKQASLDRFFQEKYAIISDLLGDTIRRNGFLPMQTERCDAVSSKSRKLYI